MIIQNASDSSSVRVNLHDVLLNQVCIPKMQGVVAESFIFELKLEPTV